MTAHGLFGDDADPEADPNNDTVNNVEAYAFRLNPAGPSPAGSRERLPRYAEGSLRGRAAIRWELPTPLPSDVIFRVEESENAQSWTETARRTGYFIGSLWFGDATVEDLPSDAGRSVRVNSTGKISSLPQNFQRLRVELNTGGRE